MSLTEIIIFALFIAVAGGFVIFRSFKSTAVILKKMFSKNDDEADAPDEFGYYGSAGCDEAKKPASYSEEKENSSVENGKSDF